MICGRDTQRIGRMLRKNAKVELIRQMMMKKSTVAMTRFMTGPPSMMMMRFQMASL